MFTKKTRVISAIATVCMLISMLACIAVPAYAADLTDVKPITQFTNESTSADAAYTISSVDELKHAASVSTNALLDNVTLYLTKTIDLDGVTDFLGFGAANFDFDGQGYEIQNWTATNTSSPMSLFGYAQNVNRIANLTIRNADLTAGGHSAIVFGSHNSKTGSGDLTIENVHVIDSKITSGNNSDQIGIFLANTQGGNSAINLIGCSAINADIDAKDSTGGNFGIMVARHWVATTVNIVNCLVKDCDINAAKAGDGVGLITTQAGVGGVITLRNVAAFNNTIKSTGNVAILGSRAGGVFHNFHNILMIGNTINTAEGKYAAMYYGNPDGWSNWKNVYVGEGDINHLVNTNAGSSFNHTPVVMTADKIASGEAAYLFNSFVNADTDKYYWETENGALAVCSLAESTRKVTLELIDGTDLGTMYVDGGETATLTSDAFENPVFSVSSGDATVDGATLTMGTTGDVTVQVANGDLSDADIKKAVLEETIKYFDDRNMDYYVADAATKLAEAKALVAAGGSAEDYETAEAALAAFKTQLVDTYPNVPSVSEMDNYSAVKNYKIMTADELIAVDGKAALKAADITLHLGANISLSGKTFAGINASSAKLDGHNFKISDWSITGTDNYTSLFKEYKGTGVVNLTLENCHVGAAYGSALIVGGYRGTVDTLTFENIKIIDSSLTRTAVGSNQMGLIVSKDWGATNKMIFKNIEITGTDMLVNETVESNGNKKINNAGFLIGSSNSSKAYIIEDIYINDCVYDVNTGAAGMVVGAAESSGTYTFNNVGVFNSVANTDSATSNASIMVGLATSGAGAITFKNCMAQNITSDADKIVWIRSLETARTTDSAVNCYSEFGNGYGVATDNQGGVENAELAGTIAGVVTADDATFASGMPTGEINAASGGSFVWTTTESGATKGDATNATRKVTLELGTGEVVGTYYANVGATVAVDYAEEPLAEYAIKEGSTGYIEGKTVTVTENADVVVAVSLGKAQELANAKAALQDAIDYYTVDRKIEYFKATVATACNEAQGLLESDDTAAILAKVTALQALQGELVDEYPNVPSISEMDKYPAVKNYKIMNADELVAADAKTALYADGITLHLGATIDLTGKSFNGFGGASCDFDGHNFTISNWTHNDTIGFFSDYKGGTIKNVTFDSCHVGGGYGRALLCGNNITGNTVINNVHVKGCSVAENSNANLGGIFSGRVFGAYTLEVKNCSVVDTELKTNLTDGNAGITNSGIISGRVAHDAVYIIEDLLVDNFQNNAWNDNTQSKGNGILFGTTEGGSGSVSVKDVVVMNSGGTYASVLVEWAMFAVPFTVENLIAVNNNSPAFTSGVAAQTATDKLSLKNVYTDETVKVLTFKANDNNTVTGSANTFENITELAVEDFTNGKAAYIANTFMNEGGLYFTNDGEMILGTANNVVRKVTFIDVSDNNKEVATLYTDASGKLNADAVAALLENPAYDWKNGEADVTATDVYTADTTLTSNATHNWENGTYEQLENGQHKLTCGDDGCTVSKIEDCASAGLVHRVDGETHVHDSVCACERVLSTDECDLTETPAGEEQHIVACGTCDYEETVACNFEGFAHNEETVGAAATHTGACACGNHKTEGCRFGDWTPVNAADLGVCGVEKKTCDVCSYHYTRTSAMLSNTVVELAADAIDVGSTPSLDIYLNIDEIGLAGGKLILTYDSALALAAFTPGEGINLVDTGDEVTEGDTTTIEIIFGNEANLTGKVLIATLGFEAVAEAGEYAVAVEVEDAVVISGEGDDATELPVAVEGATGAVTVREAIAGDVNGDGDITMADAVLVLRVVNGTLDASEISSVGADVDGVAGITTADAIAILKMVMAKY